MKKALSLLPCSSMILQLLLLWWSLCAGTLWSQRLSSHGHCSSCLLHLLHWLLSWRCPTSASVIRPSAFVSTAFIVTLVTRWRYLHQTILLFSLSLLSFHKRLSSWISTPPRWVSSLCHVNRVIVCSVFASDFSGWTQTYLLSILLSQIAMVESSIGSIVLTRSGSGAGHLLSVGKWRSCFGSSPSGWGWVWSVVLGHGGMGESNIRIIWIYYYLLAHSSHSSI